MLPASGVDRNSSAGTKGGTIDAHVDVRDGLAGRRSRRVFQRHLLLAKRGIIFRSHDFDHGRQRGPDDLRGTLAAGALVGLRNGAFLVLHVEHKLDNVGAIELLTETIDGEKLSCLVPASIDMPAD